MATPHLRKTDLGSGSGAARYPLICDDDHLLIIQRGGNAWTDKTLIATPDKEYFFNAVTYGEESGTNYLLDLGQNNADAQALQGRLRGIRDANTTTAESWTEGRRALFAYWSRGFPAYRLKLNANETINTQAVMKTMELGTSFRCLRFNFHAFPIGSCSSFRAFWRVWNPSCVLRYFDGMWETLAYTSLHDGAGVMRYNFAAEMKPPKYHTASGYGTANVVGAANHGEANESFHAYLSSYRPWIAASDSANAIAAYDAYKTYAQTDYSPYYADIEITGDGLNSLKAAVKAAALGGGDGRIYAHLGFATTDAQSATASGQYGQKPRSVFLLYVSRVELKIVASWEGGQ